MYWIFNLIFDILATVLDTFPKMRRFFSNFWSLGRSDNNDKTTGELTGTVKGFIVHVPDLIISETPTTPFTAATATTTTATSLELNFLKAEARASGAEAAAAAVAAGNFI
jgi:hypothetical protein